MSDVTGQELNAIVERIERGGDVVTVSREAGLVTVLVRTTRGELRLGLRNLTEEQAVDDLVGWERGHVIP